MADSFVVVSPVGVVSSHTHLLGNCVPPTSPHPSWPQSREYLMQKIYALRKPKTNIHMLQQNVLLKYK